MLACLEMKDNKIIHADYPVQVEFWSSEGDGDGVFMGGIAVDDYVICGCCGSTIPFTEIYESAEADGIGEKPAIRVLEWIDISESIIGE